MTRADRPGLGLACIAFGGILAILAGLLAGYNLGDKWGERRAVAELQPEIDFRDAEILVLTERIMAINDRLARLTEAATLTGIASWYGSHEAGRLTANGETFDPEAMTAASLFLPMGSTWIVSRVDTGASVVVRINDRIPGKHGRILDLSRGAAVRLGMLRAGVCKVSVRPEVKP